MYYSMIFSLFAGEKQAKTHLKKEYVGVQKTVEGRQKYKKCAKSIDILQDVSIWPKDFRLL